ncbi:DUF6415 family natural product biosynthesis protein [Streptomyces sp. NPDC021096]|uniref:DUF6415 family natural product biosynthesis protein n=1 Tax=Streptomyces sp. NPDC021096 TaxID=3154792 RepID=UPI0033CFFC10
MPPCPYTGNTGGGISFKPPQAAPGIEAAIHETTATERWLPAPGRVRALTTRLCAFINATAFDVEAAANRRPVGDPLRKDALAAVREARHRLRGGPGNGYVSAISFARGLGRTAEDLLRHQRELSGLRSKGAAPAPVAPAALVLGPAETCPVCLGFTAQRHAAERRCDWAGMRKANDRLVEHRESAHTRR